LNVSNDDVIQKSGAGSLLYRNLTLEGRKHVQIENAQEYTGLRSNPV
jgi:hypothetical protein